jgi:Antitoxin VbhA
MRPEGFVLDADIEALNQRYVNGELTSEELTAAIKRAVG